MGRTKQETCKGSSVQGALVWHRHGAMQAWLLLHVPACILPPACLPACLPAAPVGSQGAGTAPPGSQGDTKLLFPVGG